MGSGEAVFAPGQASQPASDNAEAPVRTGRPNSMTMRLLLGNTVAVETDNTTTTSLIVSHSSLRKGATTPCLSPGTHPAMTFANGA
jgi:hypothetical protein